MPPRCMEGRGFLNCMQTPWVQGAHVLAWEELYVVS